MQSTTKFVLRPHGHFHVNLRSPGLRQPVTKIAANRSSRRKPLQAIHAAGSIETPSGLIETVGEVMTSGSIYTVSPDTPVLEALELLVEKRVTGLPVVDEKNRVVGVVSDFDLLALDAEVQMNHGIFPTTDETWETFHSLQKILQKSEGKVVEDVMTANAIVVRSETSIEAASRILLDTKTRRLPVVDTEGVLVGILTRRDIVVVALAARKPDAAYFTDDEEIITMA